MKKKVLYLAILMGIILSGCSSITPGNYPQAQQEYGKLEKKYSELFEDEIKPKEINSLEKKYSKLLEVLNKGIKKSYSKKLDDLKNKVLKRIDILEDLKD
ncbi:MAG: hypothetical protein ACRC0V_08155 [Fusobacteriaceae bacterium]